MKIYYHYRNEIVSSLGVVSFDSPMYPDLPKMVNIENHFSKTWKHPLNREIMQEIALRLFDVTSELERLSFEIEYGIKLENVVVFSQTYDKDKGTFNLRALVGVSKRERINL